VRRQVLGAHRAAVLFGVRFDLFGQRSPIETPRLWISRSAREPQRAPESESARRAAARGPPGMKASANPGCAFSSGTCFSHWPAMVGGDEEPFSPVADRLSQRAFRTASLPNLRCSSSHADTQPGTVTVFQPRNGIGSTPTPSSGRRQLHGLNASGRSPPAGRRVLRRARKTDAAARLDTVTVPGCVSAWLELHRRFGKLPFEKLFETAIRYGREGFLVSPTIAGQWEKQVPELKAQPGFAEAFMPGGRAPRPGERFRFPEHAEALEQIAKSRGEVFYRGTLAEQIEAHAKKHGGAMRAEDLAAHRADWVTPLAIDYRGYTLHELPPNGQGIVALIALASRSTSISPRSRSTAPTACICRSRR